MSEQPRFDSAEWRDWLLIILLFLSGFALVAPALLRDSLVAGNDLLWLFYPFLSFSRDAIQNFQIPLWNPYHFLGFPQYAEPQLATFYPIWWLFAWSPLPTAQLLTWLFAFHIGLAAAGVFVLARQDGMGRPGALLGGLLGGWMAFIPAHLFAGHLPHLWTLAYLPWVLVAAQWAVRRRSWLAAVVAAVPLALGILAGYAPFMLYLVGGLLVWMVWLGFLALRDAGWRAALRVAGQTIVIGLSAVALTAVQLIPTLMLAAQSSRVARSDYAFASSLSLPISYLVTLFVPDAFGSPVEGSYWGTEPIYAYWELILYVGVLPLLFVVLIRPIPWQKMAFWCVLGGGALLLSLGPAAGLHRVLFDVLPGFGLFRVPGRFGYFIALALALITAHLWQTWLQTRHSAAVWRPRLVFGIGVGLAVLFGLLGFAGDFGRIDDLLLQLARFFAFATATFGLLTFGQTLNVRPATLLALLIIVLDLGWFGVRFVGDVSPDATAWATADKVLPDGRDMYRVSAEFDNNGARYGFYEVNGYDDFRTESSFEMAERLKGDGRVAQLLGARYLLHYADRKPPQDALGWSFVTEDDDIAVYERGDVLPRAFIVHDVIGVADQTQAWALMADPAWNPAQTAIVQVEAGTHCAVEPVSGVSQATITAYDDNRVALATKSDAVGWLVLSDLDYPGWEATIDGEPTAIQTTDAALRGVCVPAGEHEVVFAFRPNVWRDGGLVTLAAWVAVGLVAVVLWIRRSRSVGDGTDNG
ncbi:MAG: YfhO family protein [Anaerolineae bacterium]|nr:YfhO family protein [Anaerolineae bacterium]